MTDDDARDELDRALGRGLGDIAPADLDAGRGPRRPRTALRRARTRHRVVQASAVAGVIAVAIVVASVVSTSNGSKKHVSVIAHGGSTTTLDHGSTTSITRDASPTTAPTATTVPSGAPVTVPDHHGPQSPTATTPQPNSGAAAGRIDAPGASNPPSSGTTAPGTDQHTYNTAGGTVTVRFSNGALTLVSYQPASGYTAEVHDNQPDRVEVRFKRDQEYRVRVRVVDGQLVVDHQ